MSRNSLGGGSLMDGISHAGPASSGAAKSASGGATANWKTWLLVAIIAAASYFIYTNVSSTFVDPGASTRAIDCIDASDPANLVPLPNFYAPEGTKAPYKSPRTGKDAVWPAERCYWTKDGKGKIVPTLVLLNNFIGKEGETRCPDCGRVVYPRFPMPPDAVMIEAQDANRKE